MVVEAPGGAAFGIIVEQGEGAVIERNVVSNAFLGPSDSTGILVSTATRVAVVGNRVANMRKGIHFSSGVTSLYMDNTVAGATTHTSPSFCNSRSSAANPGA